MKIYFITDIGKSNQDEALNKIGGTKRNISFYFLLQKAKSWIINYMQTGSSK